MQTEVQRHQNSKGGVQREAMRSPVFYLQFIFLMGGWGAKLVATATRVTPALSMSPLYSESVRGMEGCGWHGEVEP